MIIHGRPHDQRMADDHEQHKWSGVDVIMIALAAGVCVAVGAAWVLLFRWMR